MNNKNLRILAGKQLVLAMVGAACWIGVSQVTVAQTSAAPRGGASVPAVPAVTGLSASVQGGMEVIKIDFNRALTSLPQSYTLQSPSPKIVMDFPSLTSEVSRAPIELNLSNAKSVQVVPTGDKTRMVFNLKDGSKYRLSPQGKTLLVILEPMVAAKLQPASSKTVQVTQGLVNNPALKNIDFRPGPDRSGRVVVELQNDKMDYDIKREGQQLVVEFIRASLPAQLRKRLDVVDFATPVQTINATEVGDSVRMNIAPKGDWDYSAFQQGSTLVIEVKTVKPNDNKLAASRGQFKGDKIKLDFQDVEIRALLRVIADFTGFNIITSDSVTGNLTLRIQDVPWDQALDIILQAKGLGMKRSGNVIWVAPKEELAAKEKAELEAQAAIQNLETLRTQSFQLNYTKAKEIAEQLTSSGRTDDLRNSGRSLLSPRGSVIAEPRTNQIFVTDVPAKLEQVQEMISKLDIPIRQVMIEARIVEATDDFGKSLGVKLGGSDQAGIRGDQAGVAISSNGQRRAGFGGSYDAIASQTSELGIPLSTANTQFFNLAAAPTLNVPAASLGLSIFSSVAGKFLNLELSAMEAESKGKMVASPRIVTADQAKAVIEQGTEIPYAVRGQDGEISIVFKKAVLKLEVTPQITPEGSIILQLNIIKDSQGKDTASGPAINTRTINTQVLVENGGTVMIGGIYETEETSGKDQVPVLGDIPVLGNLFKRTTRSYEKKEVLVFITPRMLSERALVR